MAQRKFEDAMNKLEEIVEDLENNDLTLDVSIKSFEEGMKLAQFCSEKLEEAEQKVSKLVKDSNGKLVKQPFDVEPE